MNSVKIYIKKGFCLHRTLRLSVTSVSCFFLSSLAESTTAHLVGLGDGREAIACCVCWLMVVSKASRFAARAVSPVGSHAVDALASVPFRAVGEVSSVEFFSLSLASKPSTLRRRASRTSPFGPRFFGVASRPRQTSTLMAPRNPYHRYKNIEISGMPRTMA